jgi:hypothetical protein
LGTGGRSVIMDAWTLVPIVGLAATVPFFVWYVAKEELGRHRHPAE